MNIAILSTIVTGYLFGSFQTSYLLIRFLKKEDIRDHGFGNAGASNTVSSFGWRLGALVAVIDVLKPILSFVILNKIFYTDFVADKNFYILLNGLFVILGHNYPFYMGFKGGKGTASLIGVLLTVSPIYGTIGLLLFSLSSILTNFIVLGTLSLVIYFVGLTIFLDMSMPSVLISVLIAAQSIYLHIPNFKRIFDNTETTITSRLKKP